MKFPYSSYEVESSAVESGVSIVYRPVIPFRAIGALDAAVFYGLLDTGADETVFPQAMADLIGILVDPKQTAIATSASGDLPMVYGNVTLESARARANIVGKRMSVSSTSLGRKRFLDTQVSCTTSMLCSRGGSAL